MAELRAREAGILVFTCECFRKIVLDDVRPKIIKAALANGKGGENSEGR